MAYMYMYIVYNHVYQYTCTCKYKEDWFLVVKKLAVAHVVMEHVHVQNGGTCTSHSFYIVKNEKVDIGKQSKLFTKCAPSI